MEAISTGSFNTPTFVRGQGCWLYDAEGRAHFDGTAGSGAITLGHQYPPVIEAAHRQLDRLVHTGCKFGSDARAQLVERLAALAPFERAAVLPAVIGTEAVESALKVARAATGRRSVVAFRHGYHGKSAGSLPLTWREEFRRYSTVDAASVFVAELPQAGTPDAASACEQALEGFRALLERAAAAGASPAAVIVEPIQVTEGVLFAGEGFLDAMIEISHEHGTLVVLDEIYTGMGRCGRRFYCEGLKHAPDLLIVGKSLGNGFPISAVLGEASIINALPAGIQTSTYTGNAVASAAAVAVIEEVERLELWKLAQGLGEALGRTLAGLAERFAFIAEYRVQGGLLAFDCQDASGLSPAIAKRFVERARDAGLLLFGGGWAGATVKIVPPVLLADAEHAFLEDTLRAVATQVASDEVSPR